MLEVFIAASMPCVSRYGTCSLLNMRLLCLKVKPKRTSNLPPSRFDILLDVTKCFLERGEKVFVVLCYNSV